jgi:hypothetical protein
MKHGKCLFSGQIMVKIGIELFDFGALQALYNPLEQRRGVEHQDIRLGTLFSVVR